jgi:uncharacterized protein with von Willebrand factor type A (vWA) domain
MEPSKIDETYQITLDCLVNRTAYKKYVKTADSNTNHKQVKLYESLKTSRALLCMKFQNLIKTPSENQKIQHLFEQFVEALLQEKEREISSSNEEEDVVEEDDTLFAHVPEHSPTEIEYWKMQQVFKIPPS